MTVSTMTISPSGAAQAYARVAGGDSSAGPQANGAADGQDGFGAVLGRVVDGVVQAGHQADAQAVTAINGGGNYTAVATAVAHAELSLQTAVAIRDKVVQAYQDVMRMPI